MKMSKPVSRLVAWVAASAVMTSRLCVVADEVVVRLSSDGAAREPPPTFAEMWAAAADEMAWVIPFRRELHRYPELMFNETVTAARIASVLDSLGVSFTTGWARNTKHAELAAKGFKSGSGGTGIVAEIGTGRAPCVLLRADIDALPIQEAKLATGLPFASEIDKVSHMCGHDSHAAMLLGAAAVLKKREAQFNGTVRLMWQPAEEGGAGGKRMVEEGVISKEPSPGAAFGFHQWPFLPIGVVGGRPGTQMAATELFDITVAGAGGHAALPHLVKDPIVAAAHVVAALQTIASRETSPLDAAVVSVTMVHAGDAFNVIPDGAQVAGTIRSLTTTGLQTLKERVEAVVLSTASAHRCNASISWSPDAYPPTANDPALFSWVQDVAADASVDGALRVIEPTMGGEDFSFVAEQIPAVFLALGQGDAHAPFPSDLADEADDPDRTLDTTVTVHNARFVLNEAVLQRGTALHAHLALNYLAREVSAA